MTTRRALLLAAFAAVARAETADGLLFEARHAQLVKGDLDLAIRLYRAALEDRSLDRARQAEAHVRLALCYEGQKRYDLALDPHLQPSLYSGEDVPAAVRRLAEEARLRIEAMLPKPAAATPPRRDAEEQRRARLEESLRKARTALERGDDVQAFRHAMAALDIDPGNAEARAIDAEVERRYSGVADFVRDPLRFVRRWTETRVTQVAAKAQASLAKGVAHAEAGRHNLAEAAFREALATIDGCEFGGDFDRLVELRHNVVARWDAAHRASYGRPLDPASVAPPARTATPLGDYLNQLQRLLDLVSAGEQEYRLVPVQAAPPAAAGGWQRTPEAYTLLRDQPSAWSPALFARLYLPLRVAPDSWSQRGNFLEAVGDMVVARNRPAVLDGLLDEVERMDRPDPPTVPGRFLLVPLERDALARLEAGFGRFEVSHRGAEPALYRVLPERFGLDYICSFLRDLGADVRPAHDTFAAELRNGAPQTLFAAMPLARVAGPRGSGAREGAAHFGLSLDVYPLRDRTGRTATGMRLVAKAPAAALAPDMPRFLTQESELFVDLPPGATLLVAGLLDPFAAGRPEGGEPRELLLIWINAAADVPEERPAGAFAAGAEIPLESLLLRQRDFPGPVVDTERGLVAPEALAVLGERARFLERILRQALDEGSAEVDIDAAVLRVPPPLREDAAQIVAALERESAHSYVIEVHTRAVRSPVLARWLAREGIALQAIDGAECAITESPDGETLLRGLEPVEAPDVFAPADAWPRPTALGFQARHVLSSRSRTSPAYAEEEDLATGETRAVTEGLRISVRPYTWEGNTLRLEVDLETCALESTEEERALSAAIPSHRTRFSGNRVRGNLDLGHPDSPRTALLCRIPHPTESRPDRLVELVVAITVRRVP